MKEINESLMFLFKSYLVDKKEKEYKPDKESLKKGILIDQDAPSEIKKIALDAWGIDGFILNQTFHKSLKKVVKTSDEELLLEQILHYITTYGFKSLGIYSEDTIFIPNEKLKVPNLKKGITLINITPITKEELKDKLWNLVKSSIALSKFTIYDILTLSDYLEVNKDNIDEITNRELKVSLYVKLDLIPENNIEFLRYLIYRITKSTLLIKDTRTIDLIKRSDKIEVLKVFKEYQKQYGLEPLSEIFNRFKPLFLSFKTEDYLIDDVEELYGKKDQEYELNGIINKISKLSKKHHKPLKTNDLDYFKEWYKNNINKDNYLDLLESKLKKENIWKIIKLRNYISLINSKITERAYQIRNQKIWVTNKYIDPDFSFDNNAINLIDSFIIKKLKPNVEGKKIYLDKDIDISLPQSEKQYVGNLPCLSTISIPKDNLLVGIHWFNLPNESVDLDLKAVSRFYTIGWDADFKAGKKIIFSGDITDAPYPKGASEYLYFSKDIEFDVLNLKVNNYNRCIDDVEFEIIVAKKGKNKLSKNYIVDPNDIIVRIPRNVVEAGKAETTIGTVVIDDDVIKLVFTNSVTSNRRSAGESTVEEILRTFVDLDSIIVCKLSYYLKLAGATLVDNKKQADLDLSVDNLNKNTLINLFK